VLRLNALDPAPLLRRGQQRITDRFSATANATQVIELYRRLTA
jgi:hypothetical protein